MKNRQRSPERYKSFSSYLKNKFGFNVHKIGLDAGFSCPHRGKDRDEGGCSYCNPKSFSPPPVNHSLSISGQIRDGINFFKNKCKAKKFIAYFQTYTNTLASPEELRSIYYEALKFEEIVGISIGSRPDCLSEQSLDLIQEISEKTFLIMELGLESANDETLNKIKRNHNVNDFTIAVNSLKKRSIKTCAHIILGLPGDNMENILNTARYLSMVKVDLVKIHHFHVVKETEMEKEYYRNKIATFTFEEYKSVVIKFIENLDGRIVIDRLAGDCPEDLLIAPKWNIGKQQMIQSIKSEMERQNTWQGKFFR